MVIVPGLRNLYSIELGARPDKSHAHARRHRRQAFGDGESRKEVTAGHAAGENDVGYGLFAWRHVLHLATAGSLVATNAEGTCVVALRLSRPPIETPTPTVAHSAVIAQNRRTMVGSGQPRNSK